MPGAKDIDAEAHSPAPQTALFPLNRLHPLGLARERSLEEGQIT